MSSNLPSFEYVKIERTGKAQNVALVTLNRPKALNALCSPLMDDLLVSLEYIIYDFEVYLALTGFLFQRKMA
jgi:enoyl-CoA hydratase